MAHTTRARCFAELADPMTAIERLGYEIEALGFRFDEYGFRVERSEPGEKSQPNVVLCAEGSYLSESDTIVELRLKATGVVDHQSK
jgi:hypothetical protein